jgi:hypothetical protein
MIEREKPMCATTDDIKNTEAWAELIEDALFIAPAEDRLTILEMVVENEKAARERRAKNGDFEKWSAAELLADGGVLRHWRTKMRLRALLVQVFVRTVANNHSPENAAKILFVGQHHGTGSGYLADYIDGLPRATKPKRERA